MNNADLIVQMLKSAGITHGYGIPSGNVLPFMEAMRTGGIEFVLTAHEGSAGFAADVTARMTGKPGLCIATLGPGATNLATGVGCAYLDRLPLIALTCNINQAQLGRRIQMVIDHHALFKPITKATLPLRPGQIAGTVAKALAIAMSEPQGPVHLDLPEDVALAPATEMAAPIPAPIPISRAPDADIDTAAACLRSARRPVAIIGASAMRMKSPERLCAFVERHGIPFGPTTMAKGLIDDDHPLAIGCIERAQRQVQRALLRSADLIIGIGYDTVEVEYEAWAGRVPILHVDIESADVDASVRVAHEVVGDIGAAIERLAGLPPIRNEWSPEALQRHRETFQRSLRPVTANFSPHQAIDVVRQVLPRAGVLAFDVGAHTHQIASQWAAHMPRTFLITNGWSSMGFGIPAAIAAKLARPDLPVVCIIGDGCFQMTCGEVAVAKRLELNIPFVVLDDRWLSLIRVKQERRDLACYGTTVTPGDCPDPPAHYFGVPAIAARTPSALESALNNAFSADGPTIIEAIIDGSHYSETVYD